MPVNYRIDGNVVTIQPVGVHSPDDLRAAWIASEADPAYPTAITDLRICVDARDSDLLGTKSVTDLREIVRWFEQRARASSRICAFVTKSGVQYGVARMMAAWIEFKGYRVFVTTDSQAAVEWLRMSRNMAEVLERVVRVGLAGWVGDHDYGWDMPPVVLGMIGDELYLVEIEGSNRDRVLSDIIDTYKVDDGLRIEIVFFGDAGGFFASSVNFLELWPKSSADVPADVFVDDRHRAAFTKSGDDIVVSVRHVLRPSAGPPKRQLRFLPSKYEEAMSDLARESRRLRDELISVAQQRAPEKVVSLEEAFKQWPA